MATAIDRAWRSMATAMAATLVLALLPASALADTPADAERRSEVVEGLLAFSAAFGGIGRLEQLATPLPLTPTSPASVLRLERVLGEELRDALLNAADPSLAALTDTIEAADGIENVAVSYDADDPLQPILVDLDLWLDETAPAPLSYDDGRLDFGSAEIAGGVQATLATTLHFRYDPIVADPLLRFSLIEGPEGPPVIDVTLATVDTPATIAPFPTVDGFVETTLEGEASVDWSTQVVLRDPNGRGVLTLEDLLFETPADLFLHQDDGLTDTVELSLTEASELTDATGTVTVTGLPAPDEVFPPVVIEREPELGLLTSITREEAITGLSQYTSAALAVQATVNTDLPFLDGNLPDLFDPAGDLVDLLREQATATIRCGATDTNPPQGTPRPGGSWFCQASVDPALGTVTPGSSPLWTVRNGTVHEAPPGAVAETPAANVRLTTTDGLDPQVTVSFTADDDSAPPDTTAYEARSLVRSAEVLAELFGARDLGGALTFTAGTDGDGDPLGTLEFAVQRDLADTSATFRPGSATGLGLAVGLYGLRAADGSDASIVVDAGPAAFRATFGIELDGARGNAAPDDLAAAIDPDRYYLRVPDATAGDADVYTIDALSSRALAGTADLTGRIGFLGVDADLSDLAMQSFGDAPSVRATVPVDTLVLPGGTSVDGAVTLGALLSVEDGDAPATPPTGTANIEVSASLGVTDAPVSPGVRLLDRSGTVTATWPDLAPTTLPDVTTGGDYDALRLLDVEPTVLGRAAAASTGGASPTDVDTLVDPSADFLTDFRAAPGDSVDRTLQALDAEATCTQFTVVDATTLTCVLLGDTLDENPGFAEGDRYLVRGDEFALRDRLFEGLAGVLAAFDGLDAPEHTDTLPLLNVRPAELASERVALGDLLGDLLAAAGAGDASVSTLQGLLPQLPSGAVDLGVDTLGVDLADQADFDALDLMVPLRVPNGGTVLTTDFGVEVFGTSTTTVGLQLDLDGGPTMIGTNTGTHIDVTGASGTLANRPVTWAGVEAQAGPDPDEIVIGIAVAVDTGLDAPVALSGLGAALSTDRTSLTPAAEPDCAIDADADPISGAACARLPLYGETSPGSPATLLTVLRYTAAADGSSGGGGGAAVAAALLPVALKYSGEALRFLGDGLGDALDGDVAGIQAPMVGPDLAAGADVGGDITDYLTDLRARLTGIALLEDDGVTYRLASAVRADVDTALAEAAASTTVGYVGGDDAAGATFECGGSACAVDALYDAVDVIEVAVTLVADAEVEGFTRFGTGLPGLPFYSDANIPTTAGVWEVPIVFGIERGVGPYLEPVNGPDPLLTMPIQASMPIRGEQYGDDTHACTVDSFDLPDSIWDAGINDPDACFDAVIGYLPGTVVAYGDDPSGLDATTLVELPPSTGRLGLLELSQDGLPTTTSFANDSTGGVHVAMQTWAEDMGFFDIVGTLDIPWSADGYEDVAYGDLFLVAPTFVQSLVEPMQEANRWIKPFRPVLDFIQAPVPVVSQMSEATGGEKMSLLSMMDLEGSKLQMIVRMANFAIAVAQILDAASQVQGRYVPLGALEQASDGASGVAGAFEIEWPSVEKGSCTDSYKRAESGEQHKQPCDADDDDSGVARADTSAGDRLVSRLEKGAEISVPALSFPILQDASQVFDVITAAGDATVLYVDFGEAEASIAYTRFFGPFMVGPVPLSVMIGGSVTLTARMAIGFDTRALRLAVERLDDPGSASELAEAVGSFDGGALVEGFYVDDLDGDGEDVPEVTLVATLTVGAGVTVGIFSAGLAGGVDFIIDLDLVDPDGDGKLRVEEFESFEGRYECAFTASSGLEFFVGAVLQIDLGFFGQITRFWEFWRSPRLPIFEYACDPVIPKLAVASGDDLLLTIGDPGLREGYFDASREKYVVRQIGEPNGEDEIPVEVSAFGLSEIHWVLADHKVLAPDAGDGADVIQLDPGVVVDEATGVATTYAFTLRGQLNGGDGNDRLVGGSGNDELNGGLGNDVLEGGAGDDVLRGASPGDVSDGDDNLDGGLGNDQLFGETGDDSLNGGAGSDVLGGGPGEDRLLGGPGVHPASLFPLASASDDVDVEVTPILDGGDLLYGGSGSDVVDGGFGSDLVSGGSRPDTWSDAVTLADVTVDVLIPPTESAGAIIESRTAHVPTRFAELSADQIDAVCAAVGEGAGGDRDDVTGGPDRDYLIGGAGGDRLDGGGADDLVCGLGGGDELYGDGDALDDGGPDDVRGGAGNDRIYGGAEADDLRGDAGDDLVRGGDGDDTIFGGDGADLLLGEDGIDTIVGEASTTAELDGDAPPLSERLVDCFEQVQIVRGLVDLTGDLAGTEADDGQLEGLTVVDGTITGYNGLLVGLLVVDGQVDLDGNGVIDIDDTGIVDLAGMRPTNADGDCIFGGDGADVLDGGVGSDHVAGGIGDDQISGGDGNDFLLGNAGDDVILGGPHHDVLVGGADDDHLTGGNGNDRLRGGEGDDRLIGGSSTTGASDGEDLLLGGRGMDVLAGENAIIRDLVDNETSVVPGTYVELLAGANQDRTPAVTPSGPYWDELYGGFGDDWAFGQEGDDLVRGGQDADVVEGGPGNDRVQGDDDDDLVIGGSSTASTMDPTRDGTGLPDGDDVLSGDAGADGVDGSDIVAGDNARLNPAEGGARPEWPSIRPGVGVTLFDVPTAAPVTGVHFGDDVIDGGGGRDLLLGQSGDDTLSGGDDDDVIEGRAGDDTLFGEQGDDTLVGGASLAGFPDADDLLDGGGGDDVGAGDNALIVWHDAFRFDGTRLRTVTLYDVEVAGGPDPGFLGGEDVLWGHGGKDLLFGQGGDDQVHGGDGDDVIEGNAGDDDLAGDGGQDDIVGGGSATSGVLITTSADRFEDVLDGLMAPDAAGLVDGADRIWGGTMAGYDNGIEPDSHDVILGDNGRITRPGNALLAGGDWSPRRVRNVAMADTAPGPTSGSDAIYGGPGDDDLYGQFDDSPSGQARDLLGGVTPVAGDLLDGGDGDDAILGDQGVDVPTPSSALGEQEHIAPRSGFAEADVFLTGTLTRVVELTQITIGGRDVAFGGNGDDAIHLGAGDDLANGGAGTDVLFGADGADALWGGLGDDRLWGGFGADWLDVKPRDGLVGVADGDPLWQAVAPDVDRLGVGTNGADLIYGGWDADALQGDEGAAGHVPGDRLMDWSGAYNIYYVCAAYGAGQVLREPSPGVQDFLVTLATSDGAVRVTDEGSSGWDELAYVHRRDIRDNTSPTYPDQPGTLGC